MIGTLQLLTLIAHVGFSLWLLIVANFTPTANFWIPTIVIITILGILLMIHWGALLIFYSRNIQNGQECQSHSFVIEIFLGSIGAAIGFFAFFWYSFSWIYTFKGSFIYAYPDPTSVTEWVGYQQMLTGCITTFVWTAYLLVRGVLCHFFPTCNLSKAVGALSMEVGKVKRYGNAWTGQPGLESGNESEVGM